jgi:ribosomal protein S18 acetylase RimI-like enzyme
MTIRPIKLPADLARLGDMIAESFQYPENEQWSIQTDEMEQLTGAIQGLRRMWPLIRLIQVFSPPLRDILRGYLWEEGQQVVGTSMTQRLGATGAWIITTVGVLPAYRRRGIARVLLQAALELIRERGGDRAILSVIDGNLPAYQLYEAYGFERYGDDLNFQLAPQEAPPEPALPPGYTQSPLARFDWQPRYELEQRITPASLLKYEPMEVGRFRQPAMMRLLLPVVMLVQGQREEDVVLRTAGEGLVVARGGLTVPARGTGPNLLRARLDPAHAALAPYLVAYLLHRALTLSPGRRVEFPILRWMEPLVAAAGDAGFELRMAYCRMGLQL